MLINNNVVNVLYAHKSNKITHEEENKPKVSIFKFNQVIVFSCIKMNEFSG